MILNRIGDFALLLSILVIFTKYKAVDYATIAILTPLLKLVTFNFLNLELNLLYVVCLLMFIGAIGKSAQLGLHV